MPDDPRDEAASKRGLWGDVFKELPRTTGGRSGVRDRPSRILPANDPQPAAPERAEPERPAAEPPDAAGAPEPQGAAPTSARTAPAPRGEPAPPPPGWAVPRSPPQSGRRRHTAPWTVPLVVLVLLAAGIGGFLLGGSGDDAEPGTAQRERTADHRALARYDSRLESAVFTLNQRIERGRARLRAARTARGQARAATGLSGAYSAAARSLAGGPTPEARRGANVATRSSLAAIARAYRGLARAARGGSQRRYAAAARTVERRERALRRFLRRPVKLDRGDRVRAMSSHASARLPSEPWVFCFVRITPGVPASAVRRWTGETLNSRVLRPPDDRTIAAAGLRT